METIKDIEVKRETDIGNDHCLVIMKTKIIKENKQKIRNFF